MKDGTSRIPRCTVLRPRGQFCDMQSIEDTPFPICARHAIDLFRHLSDLTDDELSAVVPVAPSRPHRTPKTRRERNKAIRTMFPAGVSVVYAVQFPDGTIKIGCTANLARRVTYFATDGGALIAASVGDYADEQEIHRSLRVHLARGREWYNPTPGVLDVVNEMRNALGMDSIAA